jgi:hypothetical protein
MKPSCPAASWQPAPLSRWVRADGCGGRWAAQRVPGQSLIAIKLAIYFSCKDSAQDRTRADDARCRHSSTAAPIQVTGCKAGVRTTISPKEPTISLWASPASCVAWSISSIRKRVRRPAKTARRPILSELTEGVWGRWCGSHGPRCLGGRWGQLGQPVEH